MTTTNTRSRPEPQCKRCGMTRYEHIDHAHTVLSLGGLLPCPFGDCAEFEPMQEAK